MNSEIGDAIFTCRHCFSQDVHKVSKFKSGIDSMPLNGWGTMKLKTGRALACVALAGSFVVAMLPSVSSAARKTVRDSTFNTSFSTMKYLKSSWPRARAASPLSCPTRCTSARYTEFDAPYLKKAFKAAGLKTAVHRSERSGE